MENAKVDELIKKIQTSEKVWSNKVRELNNKAKAIKLIDIGNINADAISNRQLVVDEKSIYGAKVWRERQHIKKLEKSRFEFYATSYQIKTSGAEKLRLINSDLADRQYIVDLYDEHVQFLLEVARHFDAINFMVKNRIQATTIMGYE
jgi:hypothetical protein